MVFSVEGVSLLRSSPNSAGALVILKDPS